MSFITLDLPFIHFYNYHEVGTTRKKGTKEIKILVLDIYRLNASFSLSWQHFTFSLLLPRFV